MGRTHREAAVRRGSPREAGESDAPDTRQTIPDLSRSDLETSGAALGTGRVTCDRPATQPSTCPSESTGPRRSGSTVVRFTDGHD